ncbi:hypothetical protein HID58_065087 [Brassica napus]|uniref:Uncharacterized protein n=1 Tax=Brassica napus TaxID=3708 RepID=A0ABQ7ZC78_BRANA|nr:hypothetical protein HID58_065087 [Brassica napus]
MLREENLKAKEAVDQILEINPDLAEIQNESLEVRNELVERNIEEGQGDKNAALDLGEVEAEEVNAEIPLNKVAPEAVGVQVDTKEQTENEWLDVSPAKASRSSATRGKALEMAQVSILSNSRFSVLSSEEEGEITGGEDNIEPQIEEVNSPERVEIKEKEVVVPRQSLPRDSKVL